MRADCSFRTRANARMSLTERSANPFVHRLNLTFAQKLQVALMSFTIAPLRLFLASVFLLFTWLWASILTCNLRIPRDRPVGRFQTPAAQSLRWLLRAVLFCMGFHWITVKGKRASAAEAPILVAAPHSTVLFDSIAAVASGPLPSCVSRIENASMPVIATLMKTLQPIYVSRQDRVSRKGAVDEIIRRARTRGKWPQMVVFPEGTNTNRKALISFKPGAFNAGVPVQPIALSYPNPIDTLSWTMDGPGALTLLWLTLCQFQTKSVVHYLPVFTPNEAEKNVPRLYANNVRNVVAEVLNLPCTEYAFEDCLLMRHAVRLKLPMEAGLVEFAKLSKKLRLDLDNIHDRLSEFAIIAQEHSTGLVNIDDFAKFLHMPVTPALREMFSLYDRDGCGQIDFRDYVIGLSLVSQPAVTDDTVQLAFKVFDKNHDGMVSKENFSRVLRATFGSEFNSDKIFHQMQKRAGEGVTYDEFYRFARHRPEYAKVFLSYQALSTDVQ